jgi:hypothetical protein
VSCVSTMQRRSLAYSGTFWSIQRKATEVSSLRCRTAAFVSSMLANAVIVDRLFHSGLAPPVRARVPRTGPVFLRAPRTLQPRAVQEDTKSMQAAEERWDAQVCSRLLFSDI